MTEITYCKNHPNIETTLRCNRCEEPMCIKCAVHTPTGYRCKDCVKEQKKVFETALPRDYFFGFIVTVILSAIASAIVSFIANFYYGLGVLLFAPFSVKIIISVAQLVVGRRRSKKLFLTIASSVVVGTLPYIFSAISGLLLLLMPEYRAFLSIYWLLPLIWEVIYLLIATPAVYAGLSGFRLN